VNIASRAATRQCNCWKENIASHAAARQCNCWKENIASRAAARQCNCWKEISLLANKVLTQLKACTKRRKWTELNWNLSSVQFSFQLRLRSVSNRTKLNWNASSLADNVNELNCNMSMQFSYFSCAAQTVQSKPTASWFHFSSFCKVFKASSIQFSSVQFSSFVSLCTCLKLAYKFQCSRVQGPVH